MWVKLQVQALSIRPKSKESAVMTEAGRLHEKHEPRFASGKLYSMLDLMGATATCDFCGCWQRLPTLIESHMAEEAAKLGWTQRDGKDACPNCAG